LRKFLTRIFREPDALGDIDAVRLQGLAEYRLPLIKSERNGEQTLRAQVVRLAEPSGVGLG
jgi:hypothetical protein